MNDDQMRTELGDSYVKGSDALEVAGWGTYAWVPKSGIWSRVETTVTVAPTPPPKVSKPKTVKAPPKASKPRPRKTRPTPLRDINKRVEQDMKQTPAEVQTLASKGMKQVRKAASKEAPKFKRVLVTYLDGQTAEFRNVLGVDGKQTGMVKLDLIENDERVMTGISLFTALYMKVYWQHDGKPVANETRQIELD